jgi:uncharacterized protein YxjI
MPRYVVARKLLSLSGAATITEDGTGRECFRVHGNGLSLHTKLSFQDIHGAELAVIEQRGTASRGYDVQRAGLFAARVRPTSLVHQRVVVEMPDNTIEAAGDTLGMEYQLARDGTTLATVTTRWTPGGGSCTADIADGENQVLMLAVVVAIEIIHHQEEN